MITYTDRVLATVFVSCLLFYPGVLERNASGSSEYLKVNRYGPANHEKPDGANYHRQFNNNTKFPKVATLVHKKPCGQLKFSTNVTGHFYKDSVGHLFFEPDSCLLRRFSSEDAKKCLSGLRLAFLGDSVTRYQYLALLHFLVVGYYPHPYDDGAPSVTNHEQWKGGWDGYYKGAQDALRKHLPTTAVLDCDDCHHEKRVTEHWHCEVPYGVGGSQTSLHLDYSYIYNTPSVEKSTMDGIKWALRDDVKPDFVIVNQGVFVEKSHHVDVVKGLLEQGAKLLTTNETKLVWKATTNHNDEFETDIRQYAKKYGWEYYSTRTISKAAEQQNLLLVWKLASVHFRPVMYEQFNDLLLNILCKP